MNYHPQRTNYEFLAAHIDLILNSFPAGYAECVEALFATVSQQFSALEPKRNPVARRLEAWTTPELGFILQEYSSFSNAAIHMLLEARIRNHWSALSKEIIRNMDEEMGVLTRGVPHLELMRYGYQVELGLQTDDIEPTSMTRDFITRMHHLFCTHDNVFLAGVLLAFEAVAVDEFRIVSSLLHRYKALSGRGIVERGSLVAEYIAGHVSEAGDSSLDPELEHCRGMIEAVRVHATGELRPLVCGFLCVCLELDRWWDSVATEALQKSIREHLGSARRESSELYSVFRQSGGPTSSDTSIEA